METRNTLQPFSLMKNVRFAVLVSAAGDMTNSYAYFNLHELTFYGE